MTVAAHTDQPPFPNETRNRSRRVVGIAEMAVSTDSDELLITFALGSCLGVSVYDPVAKVAGLLHLMLPQAGVGADKASINPHMYADTGIPCLFRGSYALGAKKERMQVVVAGGASFNSLSEPEAGIGQRNIAMLRKILWKNGVLLKQQEVGGNDARTMSVDVRTGTVSLGVGGSLKVLWEGTDR